jgi:hypothetical protein
MPIQNRIENHTKRPGIELSLANKALELMNLPKDT